MESQSFFAGHLTHVCVLNLNHKYMSALDQPDADDISHIIVFDTRYRPISLLNINCDSCILAQEDEVVRRLFAQLLDAGDTPFRGPPPKYEVDRTLPDYHEQDQEQGQTDRPRNRTNEQQNPYRRTVFHEVFDDAPIQQIAVEPLIDYAESESDDEALIEMAENDTPDDFLIDLTETDAIGPAVTARDFVYRSMNETTALAMLDRSWPSLTPERMDGPPKRGHFSGTRILCDGIFISLLMSLVIFLHYEGMMWLW